jgi:hypothetical protein
MIKLKLVLRCSGRLIEVNTVSRWIICRIHNSQSQSQLTTIENRTRTKAIPSAASKILSCMRINSEFSGTIQNPSLIWCAKLSSAKFSTLCTSYFCKLATSYTLYVNSICRYIILHLAGVWFHTFTLCNVEFHRDSTLQSAEPKLVFDLKSQMLMFIQKNWAIYFDLFGLRPWKYYYFVNILSISHSNSKPNGVKACGSGWNGIDMSYNVKVNIL